MPVVRVKDHEPVEIAIRRFKRLIEREGILTDTRKRAEFDKPCEQRKRAKAAARKRYLKKEQKENPTIDPRGRKPLAQAVKKVKGKFEKGKSDK